MKGLICPRCGAANGLGAMFRGLSGMSLNLIPIRCRACGELSSAMRTFGSYIAFFLCFAVIFLVVLITGLELLDLAGLDLFTLGLPDLGIVPAAAVAAIVAIGVTMPLFAQLVLKREAPNETPADGESEAHPGDIAASRKFVWLTLGLAAALLVIGAGVAVYEFNRIARRTPPAAAAAAQTATPLSKDALAWQCRTLSDQTVDFDQLAKGLVFVNVWATWCGPCVAELPSIARLRQSVSSYDIAFLLVSTEDAATVREFAAEMESQLPLVTADALPTELQTEAIPATFVIKKGEIIYRHVGAADWSDDEFRASLLAHL